jgi:site-specific recombinase XerC
MFKCEITGKTSKPGEKMIKAVAYTRVRHYYEYDGDGARCLVGVGSEIVHELRCSKAGASLFAEMDARARAELLGHVSVPNSAAA